MTAEEVIAHLGLARHPEGGWFKETFRDTASTAIYYLLAARERSHWHRVLNASETWHYYAGAPLTLSIADPEGKGARDIALGPDLGAGQLPQGVAPAGWWQSATTTGDWTLVGCTVAPAFDFAFFRLAPEGWAPVS